jgi:hypothetical protein
VVAVPAAGAMVAKATIALTSNVTLRTFIVPVLFAW